MLLVDLMSKFTTRMNTDEGFLIAKGKIARTGIQNYLAHELGLTDRNPNDVVPIYRPPEEVFNDESLESFKNLPVTFIHPKSMLVDSKVAKKEMVGFTIDDVARDGDFVTVTLKVTDQATIDSINAGVDQLSPGYNCVLEFTQGYTPAGERYEGIQRQIRGNHIAILPKGRGGSNCKILDKGKDMPVKIILSDTSVVEVSEESAGAVQQLDTRASRLSQEKGELEGKLTLKDSEIEALKEQLTQVVADAEAATKEDPEQLVEIVLGAMKINPAIKWTPGCTREGFMREVVSSKVKSVNDSTPMIRVEAHFDILAEQAGEMNAIQQSFADAESGANVEDDQEPYKSPSQIAREQYLVDVRSMHKPTN